MKLRNMRPYFLAFITVFSAFLVDGCNEPKLKSKWRDREITIDGINTEWQDCRLHYDKETRTTIGMFNDEYYLYICLASSSQKMQRQILGLGMTVWFDPKAGKKKIFGIHFPLGMQDRREFFMHSSSMERPDQHDKMLEASQLELELLGPGEDECGTMFVNEVQKFGINVNVGNAQGSLVYEVKVPLTQDEQRPYAIGTRIAGRIGIGFETAKMDEKKMGRRGQMGGGPGGMGGGPGGMGGGPGGQRPEPFELWTKVQLASRP